MLLYRWLRRCLLSRRGLRQTVHPGVRAEHTGNGLSRGFGGVDSGHSLEDPWFFHKRGIKLCRSCICVSHRVKGGIARSLNDLLRVTIDL